MSLLVPPRRPARELLDDVALPAEDMARSLRDLDLVNEKWGGSRALETHLLSRMEKTRGEKIVVLDVGAGSGAVARALGDRLAWGGHRATVVAVDLQWRHLAAGRAARGRDAPALAADAFSLPLSTGGADWVVSTLVFHHFSPEENGALIREFARVSRRGFALLDLRRHLFPWIFVSIAGRIVFQSRVSLLDGQASVLQAYTVEEAREIARAAVSGSRVEPVFPYRMLISGPGA
ncbi:MAG: methyltransferase domain-containing protein [Acidobacteriota bacterium]